MKRLNVVACFIFSIFLLTSCDEIITATAPSSSQNASVGLDFTPQTVTFGSPNRFILVSVTDANGQPNYSVTHNGRLVIGSSALGMRFQSKAPLDQGFKITDVRRTGERDSTWEQPWGETKTIRDHHYAIEIDFESLSRSNYGYTLEFRVFNDGLGFRYKVPASVCGQSCKIVDELTEFTVPSEATAWWLKGDGYNRLEYIYQTSAVKDQASLVLTPYTLRQSNGIHVSIHEAALVDYASMTLRQQRDGNLKAELRPWSDGIAVKKSGAFSTPWRTIQISPSAAGLANSNLILNLNEPNVLGDVSWVKPSKYIGIWWAMHVGVNTWESGNRHGATTENAIRHIDFAEEHGFDGVLIEGWNVGWDGDWFANGDLFSFTESYPDFDIEKVTSYAAEKGVKIIGHHETSGNVSNYERQMEAAFDLYKRLGVTQVKTGYVADASDIKRIDDKGIPRYEWHDGQFMVRHHLKVVQEAAKRQISVNPHEPVKDTGLRRTYPNWITREGARGMEFNAWGTPPNPPEHIPVMAFTRMLAGPMDFTPGIFNLFPNGEDNENRPQTTLAKQLASFVILYSPLQMAADLIENYEARPQAFEFIKDVPVDWEQSIALGGEVGDFIVMARQERDSRNWYIGAASDEEAREISISMGFLEPETKYEATIYSDGEQADWKEKPYSMAINTAEIDNNQVINTRLAPGGGLAISLKPIDE